MKSGGGAVLLRLDFLTVLEDEADIVGAVDDGIFDKQLFIYMRKIQKRKSELIKSVSVALRFIRSSRGLGHFPQQAKMRRVYTGALLAK